MRVILPCAGKQTRWKDNPTPKHLIRLCGEPIVHRTVRLVNELVDDVDVKIVVENPHDPAYRITGSSRAKAKLSPELGDVDKIASSRHLWDANDWTLVLFGDVWWSVPALARCVAYTGTQHDWTAFARFGPNNVGGEIFGFAIPAAGHDRFDAAIAEVAKHANGDPDAYDFLRGGWGVYRVLTGGHPAKHENRGHFVEVDDWTNDLDTRVDWQGWCARYYAATVDERKEQVG